MITLQEKVHGSVPPSDWSLGKFHRVLPLRKGCKNVGMIEDNLLSLSYGRIVRKNIDSAEGLLPESFETYQIVEPGNIVLRLTDLQNDKRSLRQGLVQERGIITAAYDAVEVSSGNDPRFWAYALLALDLAKYYYSLGGGVRQSIKFDDFPNEWIAIPDPSTQKTIADFLDRETVYIDQLITKKERQVEVLEEQARVTSLRVLSSGLSGIEWSTALQSMTFGLCHPDWAEMRLSSVVRFMTSGSRGWSNFIRSEGEVFIQSGDIGRHMEVNFEVAQRIQSQTGAEAERTLIKNGNVLICITGGRTGSVGYVQAIQERAYINQHICLLRAEQNIIIPELLAQVLWSVIGQKQIEMRQYGVKQGLGFNEVAGIRLPVPPRDQQPVLLSRIKSDVARIGKTISNVRQSIALLRERRAAMITGAVTGQIDAVSWRKRGDGIRNSEAAPHKIATASA